MTAVLPRPAADPVEQPRELPPPPYTRLHQTCPACRTPAVLLLGTPATAECQNCGHTPPLAQVQVANRRRGEGAR